MRQEFVRGHRRYIISLGVDLFEACVINRHWYGLNSRRHGRRQELFADLEVARRRFGEVMAYLIKRGYKLHTFG
jgi:hypothetical protein